ncbi:hypothetical protein B0H13DRAFT_1875635 [Mycena leptocephala]|nr:hypothetical protein B0H13DRAFT_1875635 [Mycena leptocephala]
MDTRRPKFRPLLPKPLSQARPEPFLISTPSNQYASSHQETMGTSSAHALSAKAYGQTESQRRIRATGLGVNATLPPTSKIYYRPVGAKISDLELKYYEEKVKKERGVWSQTLIVVYPRQALDQALDHEYDVNEPRRQDRYRESYRSRMLRYVAERHGAS